MPKKEFCKYADSETIELLRLLTATYPTDNKLCQTYLKQSDWRCYREELVGDIIERRQAIKHGVRRTLVKPTPVLSPLCSFDARHTSSSNWEYFRGSGWMSSKVISPVIKGKPHWLLHRTYKSEWLDFANLFPLARSYQRIIDWSG